MLPFKGLVTLNLRKYFNSLGSVASRCKISNYSYSNSSALAYSTDPKVSEVISKLRDNPDFLEWFRGFVDAEGCFYILPKGNVHFGFNFIIGLHVDDHKVLEFLQKYFQIGRVYIKGRMAS